MTVSTTSRKQSYTGTGADTALSTVFVFFTSAEIQVVSKVTSTGVETTLTEDTHYTVTGGGTPPAVGTVTPLDGATDFPITVTWTIIRVTPLTQSLDYLDNDAFPAETHEAGLDRLTLMEQERSEDYSRTLRIPTSESISGLLPSKVARASKVLGFDSNGLPEALSQLDQSALTVVTSSGITARSLAERFNTPYNVKDYGATGDGVTDDTAAVAACIAQMIADVQGGGSPGRIYAPAGKYLVSATTTVCVTTPEDPLTPAANIPIHIYGDGASQWGTMFFTTTADTPIFAFTSTCAWADRASGRAHADFSLRGMLLDSAATDVALTPGVKIGTVGMYITAEGWNEFVDLEINDYPVGIEKFNCRGIQFTRVLCRTTTAALPIGASNSVYVHQEEGHFTGDFNFTDCIFFSSQVDTSYNCVRVVSSTLASSEARGIHFVNCLFYYGEKQLLVQSQITGAQTGNIFLTNCAFEGVSSSAANVGVHTHATGGGFVNDIKLTSCRLSGHQHSGVYCYTDSTSETSNVIVDGNFVSLTNEQGGSAAVHMIGVTGFVVTDLMLNQIAGNNGARPIEAAVYADSACEGFVIDGIVSEWRTSTTCTNYVVKVEYGARNYRLRNIVGDAVIAEVDNQDRGNYLEPHVIAYDNEPVFYEQEQVTYW